ncbi:phosphoesterase [Paucibacter aquatile]|uniref:Phosphoesterase n=1 Tax=Kinneretia aquatilis TaxID=2070761 RepID=A0A2N8KTQ8_9BURK|nr:MULTISPECIES: PEP/pyruvate-binding domain-containing protein [Roseateles]PND36858.1 phosphoesterase [Paucibacter aquatile]
MKLDSPLDLSPRHGDGSPHANRHPDKRWAWRFSACHHLNAQRLGGKGAQLARLHALGLPVPDGLCIPIEAMDEYAQHNGLDLDRALGSGDAAVWAEMADKLRQGEFPSHAISELALAYEGLGAVAVAVRSSACDEDGHSLSFAGQHSSYLQVQGVPELLQRLRCCWASLFNAAALSYRRQHAQALAGARMGVVIQRMVPATASSCAGVGFARDPLAPELKQMRIEACRGLGEGLVSGRVPSDGYTLALDDLRTLGEDLAHKHSALLWSPEHAQLQVHSLPQDLATAAALDEPARKEVGALLLRCSRLLGQPQDIEWARDEQGQLWLLQSRAITTLQTLAPDEGPQQGQADAALTDTVLWSRMDIGEIFTGRMTPLGISFAKHYQYQVHRACGAGIGLLDLGDPDHYMGYYRGHVYLNVAYTAYLLSQTPPGMDQAPFLHRFSSEEVVLDGYRNPYGQRLGASAWRRLQSTGYWLYKTARELLGAQRRARRMVASRHREYARAQQMDLSRLSRGELNQELQHALAYFKSMHMGYLPFYINAFTLYGALEEMCTSWLPGRGLHLQNRLKGDMSNLRTVESARELWQLTQALQAYPELPALLDRTPAELALSTLAEHAQGQAFLRAEYAAFMRENGVRGHEEMELTHPRWVDDPSYVFQMIKIYMRQGFSVDERLANNDQHRSVDTEALLAELSPGRRWLLRRVSTLYCACSRLREETRMSMITSIWLVRRVLVELCRRLLEQGQLRDMSDMAWMEFADIQAYLEGRLSAEQAFPPAVLEARRRRQQAWLRDGEPPLTFVGPPPVRPATVATVRGDLTGLGTSRGVLRARARVILDLNRQAPELQSGEVIVTHFTDASWTPLFALAGAVVTDVGSMLSHSSIVAREFGIPSVVNTQFATSSIRSGDWLTVDGERGLVAIERQHTLAEETPPCPF